MQLLEQPKHARAEDEVAKNTVGVCSLWICSESDVESDVAMSRFRVKWAPDDRHRHSAQKYTANACDKERDRSRVGEPRRGKDGNTCVPKVEYSFLTVLNVLSVCLGGCLVGFGFGFLIHLY